MVRILFTMAVLIGLLRSENAQAQSLFGSSGSGGRSSSSGGSTSGMGSMSSAGGATGGSTGGSARSGGSNSGTGGQVAGAESALNTGYGTVGAQVGTSAFTGRATNTSFIGASTATNRNGRSGAQNFFSQLQSFANRNQGGNNSTNTTKTLMRPMVQLGFAPVIADPAAMQDSLQASLIALPEFGTRASGVTTAIDGAGVVTLSGIVTNEDDRRMAEILMRLEPGVRDVKNELLVAP